MMKIYTPKEWMSFFGGSPSLIIDDNGYIYSADGYYKLISDSPIGKIDYEKGHIYDKHYADLFPTPIAYMVNDDGVIKVMEYGKSHFSEPILYIQGDKIYTPDEYLRIFGGNASGYIKRDSPSGGGSSGSRASSDSKLSNSGCLREIVGFAVVIGIFMVWSSLDKLSQKGAAFWIPFVLIIVLTFVLRYLKKKGKLGKFAATKHSASASRSASKSACKPNPGQKSQDEKTKIISCPHCKAKCRIPTGIGRIVVTCQNPACNQKYEIDT